MKTNDLRQMIAEDSVIDKSKLDDESLRTTVLHDKYYGIYLEERRILKAMENEFLKIKRNKYDYYLGRSPDSVYEEKPLHLKIPKQDLDVYFESDDDVQVIRNKIFLQQEKCEMLKAFIDQVINKRSFHIRNAFDFIKWTNGG